MNTNETIGIQLIKVLTDQIEGKLTLKNYNSQYLRLNLEIWI